MSDWRQSSIQLDIKYDSFDFKHLVIESFIIYKVIFYVL